MAWSRYDALRYIFERYKDDISRESIRLEKRRRRLSTLFLDTEDMTMVDYQRQKAEIDARLLRLKERNRPFDIKG